MGGRDQRVEKREQERFCVSEVLFLPALWPLAGICTGLKRVCLCAYACVCGANEKSYVDTEPEAAGQRVIMHKHAYSYGTKKHTNTPNHSLYLHPISLSCNPPHLLHSVKHISNHIQSTYTYASVECILPLFSTWVPFILVLIVASIHCGATISFTLDKPIWFSFPSAFIYMQLSSKTNSRLCTADSIAVSPSSSDYTAHELWIAVSV